MLFNAFLCVSCLCTRVYSRSHHYSAHDDNATADPIAHSVSGTFKGTWMESRRGKRFQAYRGIRYAEPPIGELRFKSYDGQVDGQRDGPACPQRVLHNYYVDEDCLRLNVYTVHTITKRLPVVVYIHAGGFYLVSGRSDFAGPQHLLDKDMVLVTINYRLGSLGFLSTGDKYAPGNNGFKDQVAAMKWVQKNIAGFGGDPNLVTLAGYSAGSFSVMLHMLSPMSKARKRSTIRYGSPIKQENTNLSTAPRRPGVLVYALVSSSLSLVSLALFCFYLLFNKVIIMMFMRE